MKIGKSILIIPLKTPISSTILNVYFKVVNPLFHMSGIWNAQIQIDFWKSSKKWDDRSAHNELVTYQIKWLTYFFKNNVSTLISLSYLQYGKSFNLEKLISIKRKQIKNIHKIPRLSKRATRNVSKNVKNSRSFRWNCTKHKKRQFQAVI